MRLLSVVSIAVCLSVALGASLRVARDEATSGSECSAENSVLGNSTDTDTELHAMTAPEATCSEWKGYGSGSGVYTISPTGGCEFKVFCDMCLDQGNDGWIVIQRRVDGTVPFHHKGWEDYKRGFGDYRYNYWMGLEKMHQITSSGSYELFVGLYDLVTGALNHAVYGTFSIASESENYKLTVNSLDSSRSSISSNDDSLSDHANQGFTTEEDEHDNDGVDGTNCAHHGGRHYGGWWFGAGNTDCMDSNLNGEYYAGGISVTGQDNGIMWEGINGHSMTETIMAIRRV